MGQPKLLLELHGQTIVRGLIDALRAAGVAAVYVLVRDEDRALQAELATIDACVVLTSGTPDMRASVAALLEAVQREQSPGARDGWLLAPADHPQVDSAAVRDLLAARRPGETEILVPVYAGRRGHPTCFSWDLSSAVAAIPSGQGVNRLLHDHPELVREVACASPGVVQDLDTPADWERLRAK